jgi:N-succinyldiaminopimelate aminotransferase
VAQGLAQDDAYFEGLAAAMMRGRDRLAAGLADLGLPTLPCDGTYFLVADVAAWMREDEDDVAFCHRLVADAGVVLIPMSAFYLEAPPRSLVRFCFCKAEATIDAALARLRAWRASAHPARSP